LLPKVRRGESFPNALIGNSGQNPFANLVAKIFANLRVLCGKNLFLICDNLSKIRRGERNQ
jgi:hypothetical protein